MKRFLRNNGLSLVLFTVFLLLLLGQSLTGQRNHNENRREHGRPPLGYLEYLASGDFLEATFENWESEFFQMGLFVILTVFLYQKGSSESNPLPEEGGSPEPRSHGPYPWPVRKGGTALRLYEHSLSLSLLLLFVASFALHAFFGQRAFNEDQREHGEAAVSVLEYLGTARFWFESFQNWQSEFLAIGSIVVLSIFLREKGSAQSKPVDSPHGRTEE